MHQTLTTISLTEIIRATGVDVMNAKFISSGDGSPGMAILLRSNGEEIQHSAPTWNDALALLLVRANAYGWRRLGWRPDASMLSRGEYEQYDVEQALEPHVRVDSLGTVEECYVSMLLIEADTIPRRIEWDTKGGYGVVAEAIVETIRETVEGVSLVYRVEGN